MLPHENAGGAFEAAHERFTYSDAEPIEWSALRAADYDPRTVARGRKSFVLRFLDEQRSMLAFSELLAEMCEAGAPIDVIGSLTRVVRDEARHVEMCGKIVTQLGGWPDGAPEANWVRSDKRLPLRTRVLRTVVGSLCIGETVSVAMIQGVRKNATDPVVHAALTRMLADESFHSRFGWWWLELEAPRLSPEERSSLDSFIVRAMAAVEKAARPSQEVIAGVANKTFDPGPFGAMSVDERESAFLRVMHGTIVPGLEAAGFDGTRLWARRDVIKAA
jgi:hypothetical protein